MRPCASFLVHPGLNCAACRHYSCSMRSTTYHDEDTAYVVIVRGLRPVSLRQRLNRASQSRTIFPPDMHDGCICLRPQHHELSLTLRGGAPQPPPAWQRPHNGPSSPPSELAHTLWNFVFLHCLRGQFGSALAPCPPSLNELE